MKNSGVLYLIPVNISEAPLETVVPKYNIAIIKDIKHYIVENVRTARRFLKRCDRNIDIDSLTFYELNEHTRRDEIEDYLAPLHRGDSVGLMSEAGCPGVADPGAEAVRKAQKEGLRVMPLVGPSSILLALMASGLNGQRFAFQGYLPVEDSRREATIRKLENESQNHDMTQIFIETPYRNSKMLQSLLKTLHQDTFLCVASDITDPEKESIKTLTVEDWKKNKGYEIAKSPAIFLFYRPGLGVAKGGERRH